MPLESQRHVFTGLVVMYRSLPFGLGPRSSWPCAFVSWVVEIKGLYLPYKDGNNLQTKD